VEHQDSHVDTGIVGTRYLFDVLSENGHADLAFKIITQESYPGWGYMIKEGATTVWERWEKLEAGGMNSQNHIMLGSVDTWFYKYLVGLSLTKPGWEEVKVKPHLIGDVSFASGKVETVKGEFLVSWEKAETAFKLSIFIPFGCEANIFIPRLWKEYVLNESGTLLIDNGKKQDNFQESKIKFEGIEEDSIILNAGSGQYYFELKSK